MLRKLNLTPILVITATALLIIIGAQTVRAETQTHTYDELNRLKQSTYSDGTVIIYDYDKIGNRIVKKKLYRPHTLTIDKSGSGTGTVTSAPARINCGPVCFENFSEGTQITLTAIPDGSYTFIGWSGGGCSGTGQCVLSLTADTTVAAIFQTCSNTPVKVGSAYYTSLQAAYNAANNNDTIMSQNITLVEDFNANRAITVTLDGGYDCGYTAKIGSTTVVGTITTNSGATTIKDFVLEQ